MVMATPFGVYFNKTEFDFASVADLPGRFVDYGKVMWEAGERDSVLQ